MAILSCFPALLPGKKKKTKTRKIADANKTSSNECPKVKPPVEPVDATLAVAAAGVVEVVPAAHPVPVEDKEGDRLQLASVKGSDLSDFDFDFQFHAFKRLIRSDSDVALATTTQGRHVDAAVISADAAVAEADPSSPKLKRSCSNIETKRPGGSRAAPEMPARSRSFGDLGNPQITGLGAPDTAASAAPEASPASVKTSRTADRVMLKKRSSSQVLPSRSRKLWWRLFLWSHRNLHMPRSARARTARDHEACSPGRRHGGYASDTFEEAPAAADRKNKNKKAMVDGDGSPPPSVPVPNQWVAFCADSSIHDRTSAWVSSIEREPPLHVAEEDDNYYDGEREGEDDDEEHGASERRPRHLDLGEPSSSGKGGGHGSSRSRRCAAAADEVVQANAIVQSLNAFSSVAHISGMGLKVVPMIAPFSTLRAVNLSSNFIAHISPGSLPKGLHSLDLSRNKIANVEGLRELTKLRVLNLSYNRISRIGHGLSNCTAIRELYLAGNKMSDVEGLHRLLKLAVLDLSFNRITTARALGQLVANYSSLQALNLVGNPAQANVGDDALRRAVTGLLPGLSYLNKQPVKPREVVAATDSSVARAALGGSGSGGSRKKTPRRLAQTQRQSPRSSSLTRGRGAGAGGGGSPIARNPSRRR